MYALHRLEAAACSRARGRRGRARRVYRSRGAGCALVRAARLARFARRSRRCSRDARELARARPRRDRGRRRADPRRGGGPPRRGRPGALRRSGGDRAALRRRARDRGRHAVGVPRVRGARRRRVGFAAAWLLVVPAGGWTDIAAAPELPLAIAAGARDGSSARRSSLAAGLLAGLQALRGSGASAPRPRQRSRCSCGGRPSRSRSAPRRCSSVAALRAREPRRARAVVRASAPGSAGSSLTVPLAGSSPPRSSPRRAAAPGRPAAPRATSSTTCRCGSRAAPWLLCLGLAGARGAFAHARRRRQRARASERGSSRRRARRRAGFSRPLGSTRLGAARASRRSAARSSRRRSRPPPRGRRSRGAARGPSARSIPAASSSSRIQSRSAGPVARVEEHDREVLDLPGLDQRQRLEELVERPEAAGEDHEALRPASRSRPCARRSGRRCSAMSRYGFECLLVRELDVEADREPAALARAAVRALHHARAAAGDDRPAALGEAAADGARRLVRRMALADPRRAEDRHRRPVDPRRPRRSRARNSSRDLLDRVGAGRARACRGSAASSTTGGAAAGTRRTRRPRAGAPSRSRACRRRSPCRGRRRARGSASSARPRRRRGC